MRRSLNNWGGCVLGYLEPNNGDYGHRYIYVGDDKIGYWVGDGGSNAVTITSAPISRAEWHHVVFQWDTTTQKSKLYVDGVFVGEESIAAFGPISDRLSWAAGVNGYGFNGRIDEIGVWNRVLNDAEITQLYNGGAGKAYPFN